MPHPFALRPTADRAPRVEALAARLPRVGLDGVLADLAHGAAPCDVPGEAVAEGLTWDARDRVDPGWMPQGVACARGADVLLVAWYARRTALVHTRGSRVSVVDRSDPARPRYDHVLLTAPRPLRGLGAVPVHAGGLAVRAGLLYVADTRAGVRVFRLDDVLRVPTPDARGLGRRPGGRWAAHGHRYVLPQLLRLRTPRRSGLRFSFLSVGDVEGRLSLVVGEYGRKGSTPRLVRYPLDPDTGLPLLVGGACSPLEVHERQPVRMQGVAVHGDRWYVSSSNGTQGAGDLRVGAPGAWTRHAGVLPPGPEDLDWSEPGARLWCASEHPGRRWVFAVDVDLDTYT